MPIFWKYIRYVAIAEESPFAPIPTHHLCILFSPLILSSILPPSLLFFSFPGGHPLAPAVSTLLMYTFFVSSFFLILFKWPNHLSKGAVLNHLYYSTVYSLSLIRHAKASTNTFMLLTVHPVDTTSTSRVTCLCCLDRVI